MIIKVYVPLKSRAILEAEEDSWVDQYNYNGGLFADPLLDVNLIKRIQAVEGAYQCHQARIQSLEEALPVTREK